MKEYTHIYHTIAGYFNFQKFYSWIVTQAPESCSFVEVGSFFGKSASYLATEIMNSGKDIRLFCVDIWGTGDCLDPKIQTREGIRPGFGMYEAFLRNMSRNGAQQCITPMKLTSVEATSYFKDGSVFFVFVDAQHHEEAVYQDVSVWFKKVSENGYIGGHDWSVDHKGVINAVRRYFDKKYIISILPSDQVWLVKKSWNLPCGVQEDEAAEISNTPAFDMPKWHPPKE